MGYPKSVCISIDSIACHGIPENRKILNKESFNIDFTAYKDGLFYDISRMFY